MKTNDQAHAIEVFDRAIEVFDRAIAEAPDAATADRRRMLKAYFTDPAFRSAVADKVAEINGLR